MIYSISVHQCILGSRSFRRNVGVTQYTDLMRNTDENRDRNTPRISPDFRLQTNTHRLLEEVFLQ